MKNLKQKISNVIKTGKVTLGSKNTITTLLQGNPKLVILANNCPNNIKERIIYYAKLSKISYHIIDDSSSELGSICGKPFPVSSLGIIDEGNSGILEDFKKT